MPNDGKATARRDEFRPLAAKVRELLTLKYSNAGYLPYEQFLTKRRLQEIARSAFKGLDHKTRMKKLNLVLAELSH